MLKLRRLNSPLVFCMNHNEIPIMKQDRLNQPGTPANTSAVPTPAAAVKSTIPLHFPAKLSDGLNTRILIRNLRCSKMIFYEAEKLLAGVPETIAKPLKRGKAVVTKKPNQGERCATKYARNNPLRTNSTRQNSTTLIRKPVLQRKVRPIPASTTASVRGTNERRHSRLVSKIFRTARAVVQPSTTIPTSSAVAKASSRKCAGTKATDNPESARKTTREERMLAAL